MGATKRLCEEVLSSMSQAQGNQTRFASVRFGNVYGSRGSVVPLFLSQIQRGGPVTVTHPEMTRYFMSIPEAVNLVLHAACITDGDDTFFLHMGESVRILDLATRLIRLHGLRPNVDVNIDFTGMRPGEKLHEELTDSREIETSTAHPHIVKVRRPENSFVNVDLARHVNDLIDDMPTEAGVLLETLNMLIEQRYRSYTPDAELVRM
jgi:FlaA1/EpsC-like NDP-sugar epimerase